MEKDSTKKGYYDIAIILMGGRFKSDRIIQLCTHNWSMGTLLGSCGFGRTNQNESILSTPDYLMETLLYEDFNATRNNGKAWNSFPQEILVNFISLRFKMLTKFLANFSSRNKM